MEVFWSLAVIVQHKMGGKISLAAAKVGHVQILQNQEAVVLALTSTLLIVDQRPFVEVLTPVSNPTAANAMKASSKEYSTRS